MPRLTSSRHSAQTRTQHENTDRQPHKESNFATFQLRCFARFCCSWDVRLSYVCEIHFQKAAWKSDRRKCPTAMRRRQRHLALRGPLPQHHPRKPVCRLARFWMARRSAYFFFGPKRENDSRVVRSAKTRGFAQNPALRWPWPLGFPLVFWSGKALATGTLT